MSNSKIKPSDTLSFNEEELVVFKKLNTPRKIQDFLEKIPINFEKDRKDTCVSPRRVLRNNKAHCIEGALFAAAALWLNGERPFLLDLQAGWAISEKNLWYIAEALDESPHYPILSKTAIANLRPADPIEIRAGKLTQWKIKPG